MKKFIPFLSLAIVFAACNSKPETEIKSLQSANQATVVDTAGLAQFQQWKTQNELTATDVQQQIAAPVKEVTIIRERIVERQTPVRKQSTPEQIETPAPDNSDNNSGTLGDIVKDSESAGTTNEPAEAPKKEGWSKAAKGAAIGGAGGAVLGAIINKKNPAVGAAIGGVLGGAVGYGIGRGKDKKDGRY